MKGTCNGLKYDSKENIEDDSRSRGNLEFNRSSEKRNPFKILKQNATTKPQHRYNTFNVFGMNNNKIAKEGLGKIVQLQPSASKFFKAFPEASRLNKLASMSTNIFFLRNGSCHTCAFDSISSILITSALEDPDYYTSVKNSDAPMMKFVNHFIIKSPSSVILEQRIRILLPHYLNKVQEFQTQGRHIVSDFDAEDNVRNVWAKVMQSEPSELRVIHCQACGEQYESRDILSPNHWDIARDGFKSLKEALHFYPVLHKVQCRNCRGPTLAEITLNHHIFIELDIKTTNSKTEESVKCKLKDFPREMLLSVNKFRLAGVIRLIPGKPVAHYVSYCLRLSGNWELYNDLDEKMGSANETEFFDPQAVIYVMQVDEEVIEKQNT